MRIQTKTTRTLDKLDRHILQILQEEGRLSMKDLGERVGLSVTPCIERVKRMERDGVISGYYAKVDPAALGAKLLGDMLLQLPGAAQSKSYVVMEEIKETLALSTEVLL